MRIQILFKQREIPEKNTYFIKNIVNLCNFIFYEVKLKHIRVIIVSRGINIQHGKKERVRLKIESIRTNITA